ncbi:hypothetical protein SKAU_G00279370 [Synaphobranchus kaupii]|uniref:Uncharacterized protein n=1 Tax=Synaphobranchus kaupii TaxID=118154 RepID=A0A9Q1EWS0_SYNKA|nr:hypothetical protein SKAU_G00279370 [Synaphobranchus kaupii]
MASVSPYNSPGVSSELHLTPGLECGRELEGDKYVTLNLVCLWTERLKQHCQPSPLDSPQQAFVRQRHADWIIKIDILHKVAIFLWLKFNQMRMMSPAERDEVYTQVRNLLTMGGDPDDEDAHAQADEGDTAAPPTAKREDLGFAEWENQDIGPGEEEDEVTMYTSQRHDMADDRDLLGWWKRKSELG